MIAVPTTFVVGHPGHELRLFHWLELLRPTVHVLTDGSGAGRPRTSSTRELLSMTGCTPGGLMGGFTDAEVYEAMLSGDATAIAEATLQLASELIVSRAQTVVADAFELYNPTHDLCAVMTSIAVARAQAETGRTIARYAFAVMHAPAGGPALLLDEATIRRKLDAARRFEDLAADVDALVATVGMDALRTEVLEPVSLSVELPEPASKPFYETRGEEQVAAGKYSTVLRYGEHFVPFVRALAGEVGRMALPRRLRAVRS